MKNWTRWLACVLVPALSVVAGCSNEDAAPSAEGGDPTFNGLDRSLTCPQGQVGWNFATGGSTIDTTQGSALSGVQVQSATYGLSCSSALVGNATAATAQACNGQYSCSWTPRLAADPAYGCRKSYDVTWKCGTESQVYSLHADGEAGNAPVTLSCAPKINIVSGTFGKNCGVATGAHTAQLKAACDQNRSCSYPIVGLGDPAQFCRKAYDVEYTCGTSTTVQRKTLAGEAGGQTLAFACDAQPVIKVQSAVYGASCGRPLADAKSTADVSARCNEKGTCAYTVSTGLLGDPAYGCQKDFSISYTCGDGNRVYTVAAAKEADGKTLNLSCVGAGDLAPAASQYATGRRACVPAECSWNQRRDADMKCVTDPTKLLIESAGLSYVAIVDKAGTEMERTLSPNTPYQTAIEVEIKAPAGTRPHMVPWLTRSFYSPATNQVAEGFRCALPPLDLNLPNGTNGKVLRVPVANRAAILSADCSDVRANPAADAAKRRGMSEKDFRATFTVEQEDRLHMSIDPEGTYGLTQLVWGYFAWSSTPNPPGFYYDAARNYVDFIAFYQQRELTELKRKLNGSALPQGTTLASSRGYQLVPPKSIEVEIDRARVTDGGFQAINFFDIDTPTTSVEVVSSLIGDWPANPFSPTAGDPRVQNVKARNLRATVQVYPYNDEGGAITLGAIPIAADANPTGSVKAGKLTWPTSLRDKIFGQWGGVSSLDMKVCADLDGLNTRNAFANKITDGPTGYAATVYGVCFRIKDALVFQRDYIRRPLAVDRTTSNVGNAASNASGDSRTSGNQDSGQEKSCSQSGSGASYKQTCATTRRASMAASGDLGRTYYSTTSASTRAEASQTVTAAPSLQAEALGYQVMDEDDEDQQMVIDKSGKAYNTKAPIQISLSPNWDLIVTTLRGTPTPLQWSKGRWGGQIGIGVGLGAKIPFGGFGMVVLSASVGVSLALDFQLQFQPDNPYGCLNNTGAKCYSADPTPRTQADAQKQCKVRGGRLAEMTTAEQRAGIAGVAKANLEHWLGGQLAYQFSNATCARDQSSTGCKNASNTSYRWVGSDIELARSNGQGGPVTLTSGGAQITNNGLSTRVPEDAGITYNGQSFRISSSPQSTQIPSVCEFDSAASTSYVGWSTALGLGAGAGVGISLCTPTDDLGLCLDGTVNFVDISLKPTIGGTTFTLFDAQGRNFGSNGNSYVDVPWQLSLLTGHVGVTFNYVVGSASWTIAEYEGFKVAGGSLYRYDAPYRERY